MSVVRRRRVQLRVEWQLRDLWVGAYWKRTKWWGGFRHPDDEVRLARGESVSAVQERDAHHCFDLWVCLLPCVPIHLVIETCPASDLCVAPSCTAKVAA